ncbi:hypothetical protein DRO59_07375 [Candidatus Bathyarchaeota archaeon]|nr:MAG: hypothetical protein DRO59_07375 [Candidatus Bathyarchaeota archaeon]
MVSVHSILHRAYCWSVLGLPLIISGLTLIVFGLGAGLNYSRDRSWYMQELQKANSLEESLARKKRKKKVTRKVVKV